MSKNKEPGILRNLKIKSVSVVDQGANQHAHIMLAKRADDETPPEEAQEETKPTEKDEAFFARIGKAVAKMFRHSSWEGEVEKDAQTFDAVEANRENNERMYRIVDALLDSFQSIIHDNDLNDTQKAALIAQSADQAAEAIKTDIAGVLSGAIVEKSDSETDAADQPEPNTEDEPPEAETQQEEQTATTKGAECDMKFDTQKMTAEEKAQLEDLQKRFGMEDEPDTPEEKPAEDDDVYKGLHPAVKAEMEALRKFKADAEEKELQEVAKRYTIIGKKPEELMPVLKSLKAAGGSAYDDMIAILDSAVDTVNKSGVFGEIGKRGTDDGEDDWGKIEVAATEIMKNNPNMTRAQAIDKACTDHPDLLEAYEKSRK